MCVWCEWIERERGTQREGQRVCAMDVTVRYVLMYNYVESERNICVIILLPCPPLLLHDLVKRLKLLRIGV